ncbi:MAG: glycosyltransferase family 9 protein [Chthoniobacteraceae bacterium]
MISLLSGQRVLIVKPSSLGDVVHTLPVVHALKRARPDLQLDWLVNPEWAPLLEGNPDLDHVLHFPRSQFRGLGGLFRLKQWLRETSFPQPDLALDFQGLTRSALLARFAGAQHIHCLGDAELPARLLATHVVPARRHAEHSIDRYLRLIRDLGIEAREPLPTPLPAGVEVPDVPTTPFLLIHPFSRGHGKSLPVETLTALCQALSDLPIVIAGRSDIPFIAPAGCHQLTNLLNRTTLPQLIWLIRRAAYTLSVDSGPMHIASAITDRLLALHTWSDPRLVGPHHPHAWIWKGRTFYRADAGPQIGTLPSVIPTPADAQSFANHLRAQWPG